MSTSIPTVARGSEWGRWGPVFLLLAILSLLIGICLIDLAAPQTPNLLDKRWDSPVRTSWDVEIARVGLMLVVAGGAACGMGLLVRVLVGHGSGDRLAQALVVIGLLAALTALVTRSKVPLV